MKKYQHGEHAEFTDIMSDTAADWVAREKAGLISREDKVRMDDWLGENPSHKATYDRMNAIWDEFGEFEDHPLVVSELDNTKRQTRRFDLRRFFGRIFTGFPFMRPVTAAVPIVLVVAIVWVIQQGGFSTLSAPGFHTYKSETGQQKTIQLSDGSTAILDTNTEIEIQYLDSVRNAVLIAGSALFSVTHDPGRPFIVKAKNTRVQVLGTEFNVSMENGEKVVVAVLQGSVRVSHREVTEMKAVAEEPENPRQQTHHEEIQPPGIQEKKLALEKTLTSGQSVVVDEKEKVYEVKEVKPIEIKRIASWRDGKLDFDRAPLEDVLKQINRYVDQKLVIGDDELKKIRISVILKISDAKHFLTSIEELFPIDARLTADNKIILTKRHKPVGRP